MTTMTKREVARHPAAVWAKAETGETVYVLDRGQPRYRIEVVNDIADPVEQLRRQGLISEVAPYDGPLRAMDVPRSARSQALADFEAGRDR